MNNIAKLYDEVMRGMPPAPVPSVKDLESLITQTLRAQLINAMPAGIAWTGPEVTSRVDGDQVVFTARVAVPHKTTAIEAMAQAIEESK